ncbi:MAG: prepilin-type N-terminal cleavage/methylation domain-containing protein [Planctomycetes bacterium]|nr:prepilin-type N-terminal cleavage/methylation domain-containing protein [Planctomycetota bacterium]
MKTMPRVRPCGRSLNLHSSGFSLLELMVTMGLATLLLAMGAGVYVKMGRRTAAVQAMASVNQLVTQARNASTRFPATIVADAKEMEIRAYTDEVVQELHFETRITENGDYVPQGIEGRDCSFVGSHVEPTAGRLGGALKVEGGSVTCGTFAAYDVDQGINAEVWIKPVSAPKCDLVTKGRTFKVKLDSFPNRSARVTVTIQLQDDAGAQDAVSRTVDLPAVRLNEWLGFRISYDRSELVTSTNDGGYGWVSRDRWKESRRLAVDPDAPLVIAAGLQGWLDDVRIGGIRAAEPLRLPAGVELVGLNPPIRFVDGRLDPAVHSGPARLAINSEGKTSVFEIGQSGAVLSIHDGEAVTTPNLGPKPVPVPVPKKE